MAACLAKREVIFVDPVHIFLFHASDSCLYWVTRQDVAQETEELAALASAAHSAHFSVSCATSCLVTQYSRLRHGAREPNMCTTWAFSLVRLSVCWSTWQNHKVSLKVCES